MANAVYFPILKAQQGECDAVAHLSPFARALMQPIFDMPKLAIQKRGEFETYLCDAATKLVHHWGTKYPFMVDFSRYAPDESIADGTHPVTRYFACLRQLGASGIPVAGPESVRGPGNRYLEAVSGIAKADNRGLALRLPSEDLLRPDNVSSVVAETLRVLSVSPEEVDLILDMEALIRLPHEDKNESALTALVFEVFSALDSQRFRNCVVCGSNLPENLGKKHDWQPTFVPRLELAVWKRLSELTGNRIGFGDYGIVFPFEADSGPMSKPPARIRLSSEREHVIVRAPSEDYGELCDFVFNEDLVSTDLPCWGLAELRRCRKSRHRVGSPTNWVARDTSFHLERTVRDVNSILEKAKPDAAVRIPSMDRMPWYQDPLEFS